LQNQSNSTRYTYFHINGSAKVLNTVTYAVAQSLKQGYLDITEANSDCDAYYIVTITPKRWDSTAGSGNGTYVTISLDTDLSWKNGHCD
jgi:hypothetical protein